MLTFIRQQKILINHVPTSFLSCVCFLLKIGRESGHTALSFIRTPYFLG